MGNLLTFVTCKNYLQLQTTFITCSSDHKQKLSVKARKERIEEVIVYGHWGILGIWSMWFECLHAKKSQHRQYIHECTWYFRAVCDFKCIKNVQSSVQQALFNMEYHLYSCSYCPPQPPHEVSRQLVIPLSILTEAGFQVLPAIKRTTKQHPVEKNVADKWWQKWPYNQVEKPIADCQCCVSNTEIGEFPRRNQVIH